MARFGSSRMKITFLLLLSVLTVLITLGCLQKPSDNPIKEISPEMLGMRIHTDREVYVKEPVTIFVENIGNKTIKIKPKIPWEICSDEGCLEVKQSSVAFGIKKNGYESGEWIVIDPGGIVVWTYSFSLVPGEYLVKPSKDAVVVVDGKEHSVKATCKFKVLEKEPGLKVGRLYLLERESKFGNINLRGSEISVEGVVDEEGKGLSLLFSIKPPLNDSLTLRIKSDLGFVKMLLYSTSSSWYTIKISNFVNKTNRTVDVREKFFKETLNVSVAISKECVTVENIDTGEEMMLYPSEDRLKEVYGDSLEISRTMPPPRYIVYGDTMSVSLEFGKREEVAEYLLISTGFSSDIPREPKLWIKVLHHIKPTVIELPVNLSDDNKSLPYVKVGSIKPTRVKCDISEEEVLRRALQNEDIKEFAEGKDLIFLLFPSKSCDKFYVDTRDLQKPDDTLRLYFYYPESDSFILKGWKTVSPRIGKTYEMISEEEARKYNVSLNAKNMIYIKCVTSVNSSIVGIEVVGIGWNDSVSLNGFEVSKAEVVRSVFIKTLGWSAGRDYVWIVRNK